jgi:hypothetical protein
VFPTNGRTKRLESLNQTASFEACVFCRCPVRPILVTQTEVKEVRMLKDRTLKYLRTFQNITRAPYVRVHAKIDKADINIRTFFSIIRL